MSAPASIALLQAEVTEILRKSPEARAVAFQVGAPWSGPSTLRVEGADLPLFYCPSPLAFRVRLVENEGSPVPVVLLTDRDRQELGLDVLARLAKRRLFSLDSWRALIERFGVQSVDPRLRGLSWLPEELLALGGDERLRPATQILDADEVWQLLLSRLGLPEARPDLRTLLEWTATADGPAAFLQLPEDVRAGHARRLAETAGDSAGGAAAAVLYMVASRRGDEAIAAGLICDLLFLAGFTADPETARGAGRFEAALLGGVPLTPQGGRAWAEASSALVAGRLATGGEAAVNPWLAQGERLLDQLSIQPLGERSSWLPSAFAARIIGFARRMTDWLDHPDREGLAATAAAADHAREHGLKTARMAEIEVMDNLLRLGRYLESQTGRKLAGSFAEAAGGYAREGSFVDRARTELADAGHLSAPLRQVADRVLRTVTDLRETENRRFAELLAKWSEHPTATGPLIPLESVLDQVVAPLAAAGPVLLLVLDGLSFAVFREMADDLPRQGWEELRPAESSGPSYGVSLLPSVTQACRSSLLSGERRTGDAADERRGFAAHPALRQQSSMALPPILFHKASLEEGGTGLAEKVAAEVERGGRRVVGAVLNVVDDQLSKGRQLVTRWQVENVRYLGALLQAAQGAGRTVILTADHGHLVERDSELRRHEGAGARYRRAGAPPGEGEVAARGPRVLLDDGKGLVLAWSERLRFAALQSGYHGGASPQEVIVPLAVWVPAGVEIPGWVPAGPEPPAWWREESERTTSVPAPAIPARTQPRKATPPGQGLLFAPPTEIAQSISAASIPRPAWLADLLTSPVYREQLGRAGRQSLNDERVEEALKALETGGGRLLLNALAHQLAISPSRAQGLVAVLQRVLNVEGFSVLALDPGSETVSLDRGLLARQFPPAEEKA